MRCNFASSRRCWLAAALLTLCCTPVVAESLCITQAFYDVERFFTATQPLSC